MIAVCLRIWRRAQGGGQTVGNRFRTAMPPAVWHDKPICEPIKSWSVITPRFCFAKLLSSRQWSRHPGPRRRSRCDRMDKFARIKESPLDASYMFWREGENGMEAAGPLAKNIGPERPRSANSWARLGMRRLWQVNLRIVVRRTVIGDELGLTDTNLSLDCRFPGLTRRRGKSTLNHFPARVGWRIGDLVWAANMIWPVTAMNWVRSETTSPRLSKPLKLQAMKMRCVRWDGQRFPTVAPMRCAAGIDRIVMLADQENTARSQ